MSKIVFQIILFLCLSANCNAQNSIINETNWIAQFRIEAEPVIIKKAVKRLQYFNLPQLEIKATSPQNVAVTFATHFDSTILKKMASVISIEFEERYDFTEVAEGLSPIMPDLEDLSVSRNTSWLLNDYNIHTLNSYLGPIIGEFHAEDTIKINKLIKKNSQAKTGLPQDLSISWFPTKNKDILQLLLGKKPTKIDVLSESHISKISTLIREISETRGIEIDQDGNQSIVPIEFSKYNSYELNILFDKEGAEIFSALTNNRKNQYLTININNHLFSSPVIYEPILDGKVTISGTKTNFIIDFYTVLLFPSLNEHMKIYNFEMTQKD